MTDSYRPEGFATLTPMIIVSPATDALRFYEEVFGAEVTTRMDTPDGVLLHCETQVGNSRLQLMDPNPQFAAVASDPQSDQTTFSLAIYLPDVDAALARARERGAVVREEAADFEVTGDRFASIRDPFGVRWTLMCRRTERTDEQIQQALDAWAASMTDAAG